MHVLDQFMRKTFQIPFVGQILMIVPEEIRDFFERCTSGKLVNIITAVYQNPVHSIDIADGSFPRGDSFQTSHVALFVGDFLILHRIPPLS